MNLKRYISDNKFLIIPGVFDGLTALLAHRQGFKAMYMTGYGVTASYLGMPDAGLATYTEFADRISMLTAASPLPLIADADTGFGGPANIERTIRGFEKAGASAIQIEDQQSPKRCGHVDGKTVIPAEEMAIKVKIACDSRRSSDTMIIARSDALATHGLDEALGRCELYAKAGADILFVDAPVDEEQLARIGGAFDTPTMANVVPGGKTPVVSADTLAEMGFAFAIYPSIALLAAADAIKNVYADLAAAGIPNTVGGRMTAEQGNELFGFGHIRALEQRYATAAEASDV